MIRRSELLPEAVERNLRRLEGLAAELRSAELASGALARAARRARGDAAVGMTPAEVDLRLRELSDLRDLCLELGACK